MQGHWKLSKIESIQQNQLGTIKTNKCTYVHTVAHS